MNIRITTFFLILSLTACGKAIQPEPAHHTNIYFTPGADCENAIIEHIQKSERINIAVYAITNTRIADAIITAHNRGAQIRIVTDRVQSAGKNSLVAMLHTAQIPVKVNTRHKIEHNKFAIFDNTTVVSGSYNWTENASRYNSENCIFITNAGTEYPSRFEYLWNMYRNYD